MRIIDSRTITDKIKELFIESNYFLTEDVMSKLQRYRDIEISNTGKEILDIIITNAQLAAKEQIPICQDTGMSIVFAEIGQDVHIQGDNITDAINNGVRMAYEEGYLRKSVVKDPLNRINTEDNTPAVIHYELVKGNKIIINVMPKGFGSENMSKVEMLKPSEGEEGVIDFVVNTIKKAGANPCPPIVIGIGIGGTMEKAAIISKKALLRPLNKRHNDKYYSELECKILQLVNDTGIGPQGLGGITTALAVNIEVYPTHIAGLPVAISISCHASRHKEVII